MAKKDKGNGNGKAGHPLSGKISDRIRSGEVKAEVNPERGVEKASKGAMKGHEGHKLGSRWGRGRKR
jgi:hypothetical protein